MATTEEDLLRQLAELEAGAPPGPEPVPIPEEQQEQQLGLRSDIAAAGKAQELEAIAAMEPTPVIAADPYAEVEKRYETQRMFVDPYAQLAPGYEPPPPTEFPSPFPMEPGTSRASLQLPELVETGTGAFLPPDLPVLAKAGITAAVLTTTDPNEIAQIFSQTYTDENTGLETQVFPNVGVTTAPDGVLILTNRKTGKSALINRPGISGMDVLQLLGLGMTFTPAGRISALASAPARTLAQKAATETAKKLALKTARKRGAGAMMAGSGVTETALQTGQVAAGGSFDPADIALSTAVGAVPDYVLDPLIRAGTKLPAMLPVVGKKIEEVVPQNIMDALRWAKETGRKIQTSDALMERLTPAMNIFFKITERIPVMGTGGARITQRAQRADALTEIADRFGIDIESEYGKDVMESFVDRMILRRFWGQNVKVFKFKASREKAMLARAYEKEADEISSDILSRYIRKGKINEEVVDKVLDAGDTTQLGELLNKLLPAGKEAAKQRFIAKGLEKAGWIPEAPHLADPAKFVAYLNTPAARRNIKTMFDEVDQDVLIGAREYLRLTLPAQTAGKGAGMAAAMAGGAGFAIGVLDAVVGAGFLMGRSGALMQSAKARNFLLKMAHAKGDEKLTASIMAEARPYFIALENQWKQENWEFPSMEITQDMLMESGTSAMDALKARAIESGERIMSAPERLMDMLGGGEQ